MPGADGAGDDGSPYAGAGMSAANALHNLLCKLGSSIDEAGIMSFMAGSGSVKAKYKTLIQQLQNPEEVHQLQALMELCEVLSMSTEEQLAGFPIESVVPTLVTCLSAEHNPDLMLYAARALTWLADVMPASCACIVSHNAITAFCSRLLAIQFIDVAEQSLQALEKISLQHPDACLRQGGMKAVLSYLDFFPTAVQRSAVATAASMASKLTSETMPFALEVMPNLLDLAMYQDANIVDSACLALSRVATAAAKQPAMLAEVAQAGLVEKGLSILEVNEAGGIEGPVTPTAFFLIICALKTCAAASPDVAGTLLQGGLHNSIHRLLAFSGSALANGSSSSAVKTQQQLAQVLDLLSALLPGLPPLTGLVQGEAAAGLRTFYASGAPRDRAAFFQSNPDLLLALDSLLLPLLHRIYGVQVHKDIRSSCIGTVTQLIYHSSSEQLSSALLEVPFSSFLVGLLSSSDPETAAPGVVLAELLMHKLPDLYQTLFVKEGTCHALGQLAAHAPPVKPVTLQVRTRAMAKTPPPADAAADAPTPMQHCGQRAQRLMSRYFSDSSKFDTDGLVKLRKLIQELKADRDGSALQHLLDLLAEGSLVSTFELATSGVIESVTDHLSAVDIQGSGPAATQSKLQRLSRVTQVLHPASCSGSPPIVHLVRKLVSVLEATEAFEVSMTPLPSFATGSSYSRRHAGQMSPYQASLYALTQPLKLRLQRASTSTLRDCSSATVLVEPLAKLSSVEDFLWNRAREGAAYGHDDGAPGGAPPPMDPAAGSASHERAAAAARTRAAPAAAPGPAPARTKQTLRRVTRSQSGAAAAEEQAAAAQPPPPPAPPAAAEPPSAAADMDASEGGNTADMAYDMNGMMDDEHMDDEEDDDDEGHLHDHDDLPMVQDLQLPDAVEGAAQPAAAAAPASAEAAAPPAAPAAAAWHSAPPPAPAQCKLLFLVDNVALPQNTTVLQAVLKSRAQPDGGQAQSSGAASSSGARSASAALGASVWDRVHTLHYTEPKDLAAATGGSRASAAPATGAPVLRHSDTGNTMLALVQASINGSDLDALAPPSTSRQCLLLLRLLETLVLVSPHLRALEGGAKACASSACALPRSALHSTGLNSKVLQQLKDTVALCAGTLPPWACTLPSSYRFLFPFETRRRFLYSTAFTVGRTLNFLQQIAAQEAGDADSQSLPEMRVARQPRQKVRVSRTRILESAVKVFSMPSVAKNVLEFEFFNEVGTGLGPTLEFYTLLAVDLQKKTVGMWRDHSMADDATDKPSTGVEAMSVDATRGSGEAAMDTEDGPEAMSGAEAMSGVENVSAAAAPSAAAASGSSEPQVNDLVYTSYGLFPRPYAPGTCPKKVLSLFDMLGKAVAKCLQDSRMLDLQLAPSFFRAILGHPLDMFDLERIDPGLAASLYKLKNAISKHSGRGAILVDGCTVEDLALSFVLPGYPEYELVQGGKDLAVTSKNVSEYLELVVSAYVEVGIRAQLDAFTAAANTIFDITVLRCLYEDELETMLCGQAEVWTRVMLLDTIKCDHGYTRQSAPIQHLVDVLCELDAPQQRAFLRFITGSPRLPPGGLAALQPRLTIVCKRSSGDGGNSNSPPQGGQLAASTSSDQDLPSVMTCANYMKLPPYSSLDVCRERLMYAVSEGQGSFDLS